MFETHYHRHIDQQNIIQDMWLSQQLLMGEVLADLPEKYETITARELWPD